MHWLFAFLISSFAAVAADADAQTPRQIVQDGKTYEVIDSPPPATPTFEGPPSPGPPDASGAPTSPGTPSTAVILNRPGTVLLSGTPVKVRFESPTPGIGFQLRLGGSYSSISGVSYGVGWGAGWGWGGYGWGGYGFGVAPYYGEVVTKTYQPICEAPCDATLLSGRHRFALSLEGNRPVEVREPIDLTADSVVVGRYVDKRRLRKTGWAVFAAGAVTGMALMFASVNYRYDPTTVGQQLRYPAMFYTGLGVFLGSIISGSVLAAQDDEAHLNVFPAR